MPKAGVRRATYFRLSALVVGAGIGARWSPPAQVTRVLLAFASGALISALAFELFEDSFKMGGPLRSGVGLLAGAAAFILIDSLLERRVQKSNSTKAKGGVGLALVAAVTLDGVPENLALGVTLVGGAVLASVADTLMPEAFEHGKLLNAFATAGGFFLAYVLSA